MTTLLLFKYGFDDFAFNVFCNLFSSAILIVLLIILFVPKIKISPFIVGQDRDGKKAFTFKIVNQTSFSYHDVRVHLNVKTRFSGPAANINVRISPLKLTIDTIKYLPRRRLLFIDRLSSNAIQFHTEQDIESILSDPYSSVELIVDLTHPVNLSSTPRKLFLMEFADMNCIKMGKRFKFGNSVETI